MQALGLGPVGDEFDGAELGDDRLGSRLLRIAQALESDPAGGFPKAMRSDAALEGLYRFINNERFSADDIVAPHLERTFERAREAGDVLAIHDSSYFQSAKQAPRRQAGIKSIVGARGFIAHVALVTTLEGMPLEGLNIFHTQVEDLSPLRRSPLRWNGMSWAAAACAPTPSPSAMSLTASRNVVTPGLTSPDAAAL